MASTTSPSKSSGLERQHQGEDANQFNPQKSKSTDGASLNSGSEARIIGFTSGRRVSAEENQLCVYQSFKCMRRIIIIITILHTIELALGSNFENIMIQEQFVIQSCIPCRSLKISSLYSRILLTCQKTCV